MQCSELPMRSEATEQRQATAESSRHSGAWPRCRLAAWALAPLRSGRGAGPELARIKDVATIEGIRDNQLVGYGLVVGLRGTGDSSQTVFPAQTLVSALERMGITVPQTGSNSASNMQVKNMAAVFVVATLPPFSRPGYQMDITVSSAGDARSLEGGILLMTPLYGPDGQIYAQAQGALVLGGYMATAGATRKQMNHPTTARIPGRRAGGAAGSLRPEADAHGQRGAERRRFSHRRADGGGHRQGTGFGAGARRGQPPGGDCNRRRTRMWRRCWTRWKRWRSRCIRGRGWW